MTHRHFYLDQIKAAKVTPPKAPKVKPPTEKPPKAPTAKLPSVTAGVGKAAGTAAEGMRRFSRLEGTNQLLDLSESLKGGRDSTGTLRFLGTKGRDSGTSEGAKKAAATRRQGSTEHSVRTGGNYGVDIKAGSNVKRANPRPDPEPYRGYDSRRK